ncbi:MAG: hypothetical protein M3295_08575 [Chloroflexota bacterium]|nr:hypothetical protein [Chloroflexota bacterium]
MTSSWPRRLVAVCAVGLIVFVTAWSVPLPKDGHHARDVLVAQVKSRFPGWEIVNLSEGQEASWVVAVRCGAKEVGFRLMRDARPVTGVPWGDYWVSPVNGVSRARLRMVTQPIQDWLLWRASPSQPRHLACDPETARRP